MVAITVILAAVIAAFVLDLGDSVDEEAQAGVSIDTDEDEEVIQIEVTSLGNADHVNISGHDVDDEEMVDGAAEDLAYLETGDAVTIGHGDDYDVNADDSDIEDDIDESGTVTAVAVIEADDSETTVASEDYDFDWE